MVIDIRDQDFVKIADSVKPDTKKRVALRIKIEEGISYHIYKNKAGQIVLDPQVTIPASEAWLFNNPEALASVKRGLLESALGQTTKIDLNEL